MNCIPRFLSYVEIKTKITSVLTFVLTIVFLLYRNVEIKIGITALFFISMFLFDLTTTAINNYIDTKTNTQTLQFSRGAAFAIIMVLLGASIATGIGLALKTDFVILAVGGICFLAGIFYTYGPIPISRQPFGEILSGLFYGFFIPFIIMYINYPMGTFLTYSLSWTQVELSLNLIPIGSVILFAVTPFCLTANIMLANNYCDIEKDVKVKRYTLPYYIGEKALYLFAFLYYLTYVSTVLMVILGILHPFTLISLITFPLVQKNINTFFKKQEKETTFHVAIINFIVIMLGNIIPIGITILF